MMESILKERIRHNIQNGLPGLDAQAKMAPFKQAITMKPLDDHRKAGVVALLYPKDGEVHILFIIRGYHPKDRHSGQIGFPGGKYEDTDEDMLDTALREVEEEIGVHRSSIEILTPLTERYLIPSNFLISPFLGFVPMRPDFILQEEEVAEIVEIPISMFQKNIKKNKDIDSPSGVMKNAPYYDLDGRTLWGATAMIMSEIEAIIF